MLTYLLTFAFILLLLYSAVHVHMLLGLNRPMKKENRDKTAKQSPRLDDVLFGNQA